MTKHPLAVVTMAYNESIMLPIWLAYYSRHVGAENCYIIDHGSTDYSVTACTGRCSVTRIPRSSHDDGQRVRIVGKFCASLLESYDRVLYTDADEIIVADPLYYHGLLDFCVNRNHIVTTMFGVDVVHDFDRESPIDLRMPLLKQRSWIKPNGFLCKPSLISREVQWWSGFHGYDGGNSFDNIYLFHIAYIDHDIIFRRQMKRNASAPVDGGGSHHTYSPAEMIENVRRHYVDIERHENVELIMGSEERERYLDSMFEPGRPREELHMRDHHKSAGLWRLPERFRECI